ncbi:MAG: hypothetical protein U0841_20235 [Chloroflexia bacterium]
MTSIYADQLAIEEYFAVGSASAVPEMRALTSSFVAVAIAISVGAAAAQIFKMRYRRAQV